jgi:geranyl-CoA carboxylase alpha subunit
MTTTRLDEWAAAREPLLQEPQPPELAWRLAAALLAGGSGSRPPSVAGFDITLVCQGQTRTLRAPPPELAILARDGHRLRFSDQGVQRRALAVQDGGTWFLALDGATFSFTEPSPYPGSDSSADPRRARAPVAGVVAQVAVAAGDVVAAGQALVCVEAMKMEMWLHAAAAGTVRAVHVKARDSVASGAVLVELEIAE